MSKARSITGGAVLALLYIFFTSSAMAACDRDCLLNFAKEYRAAYVRHDPTMVPLSRHVRFTENNVEMPFPDASWDTVTKEVGPPLTLADPKTGNIGIFTTIMQMDTPGFLAIRLKVKNGEITEIEHMLSTKRNLSGPPTPIGKVEEYEHDPAITQPVPSSERASRRRLEELADGYYKTLQRNDGEIRGTSFSHDATRRENGLLFKDIESGFKSGFYYFNNKVRRQPILVDETLGVVLCRGFIDHKGDLDTYKLTNGKEIRSVYREPHSWAFLEMFKIRKQQIVAVEATFIGAPYNMHTPWSNALDP